MKAMIFAAGLGTRLRPLTDTMPKAMVPLLGKPMIGHLIEKLVAAGCDDIVINVHHFASQIIDYVHSNADFGIKISFSDETSQLLDTGGGLLHARPLLQDADRILIHNVDIVTNLSFSSLQLSGISTLVVSPRKTSRYLLFREGELHGWKNVSTGQLRGPVVYSPAEPLQELAFAGIHMVSSEIFPLLEAYAQQNGKLQDGEILPFSIIDFYLAACAEHRIEAYVPEDFKIVDAGKIESLPAAEALL